jgi:hypothetical protein
MILASPVRGLKRWIAVHKRELRLHYPMHRIQHQRALARHVRVMATVLCNHRAMLRTRKLPCDAKKYLIVSPGGVKFVEPANALNDATAEHYRDGVRNVVRFQ